MTFTELTTYFTYDGTNLRWAVDRRAARVGDLAGCKKSNGYIHLNFNKKHYLAHHLVWLWHHQVMPTDCLDHINGDPSDNRIENLRECSIAENNQNKRKGKNNTSGYTGVTKNANKWRAGIKINGKQINLGNFNNIEDAQQAYKDAKNKYHVFNPLIR